VSKNRVSVMVEYVFKTLIIKRTIHQREKYKTEIYAVVSFVKSVNLE